MNAESGVSARAQTSEPGDRADVLIVGAGAMGCSLAFHLARAGVRRVIVVDKGAICSGMTFRSGALVRLHYTNEPEARIALRAYEYFHRWDEIVGGDCGFVNTGFLFVVGPEQVGHLERNVAMLQALGVNTEIVGPEVIKEAQPYTNVEGIGAAAYEPESGYADPQKSTQAFAAAAKRLGAVFKEGCAVRSILTRGGRAVGVATADGPIEADAVVVMAGPWTDRLLATVDVPFSLTPTLAEVVFLRRPAELAQGHMVYIDRPGGLYFRPHANRLTFVGAGAHGGERAGERADGAPTGDPDHLIEGNTPGQPEFARDQVARRVPVLGRAEYAMGHQGVYDTSPDGKAVLDRIEEIPGLYVAAGFSGTGFKKSPAIGLLMSELILQGAAQSVDIRPFRRSRFAEGDPIVGPYEYGFIEGAQLRI
jgi:sarcosine oxidase subunit beta